VGMWRRGLRRAVDKVTQDYLDGKTGENGLQEPISDVVAYSVYLIPCVQSMGESWDPAMKLLIDSTRKEFASSDELASFIFLTQMKKAGADINNVKGFWEGRNFKVIP
ncbi:MAG: hypothetical protein QGG48_12345, partial [Desulfatiglandales bacterium]|nr:hypothetical protein [Desulfatiglandales bacterium]